MTGVGRTGSVSDSRLRNLLAEINLDDQLNWVETKTGFYTDGQLYSMSNTREFLGFPPLTLIEKLRLGGTIFYASKISQVNLIWIPSHINIFGNDKADNLAKLALENSTIEVTVNQSIKKFRHLTAQYAREILHFFHSSHNIQLQSYYNQNLSKKSP